MTVDYIIIGQGVCGTWLSYYLLHENKTFVVIDKEDLQTASNVSSGLINPVTGRRVVTTWMADKLMPFVWQEYNAASSFFNTQSINQKNVLVFPSAPDLQNAFQSRIKQQNSYIQSPGITKEELHSYFYFPFDVFEIAPCYVVSMHEFLSSCRKFLLQQNLLINEMFDENEISFQDDFVQYKNIQAKKIIYANGIQSSFSMYWMKLPFINNKGQALIAEIDGLNSNYTYKFGHLTLIALQTNFWWIGSSNELNFQTTEPTEDFKQTTTTSLQSILKMPFAIKEHWASLRPATVERRPFVGTHPVYKQIAILNGMGSKGCSLAPWFAKELVKHLEYKNPIDPLADVQRFSKMLSDNI
ncbi:MAG: FAD-dependent oxidoreductase [Parafilimonas sp.]|nr:FAD-dependent oxidoreductase [Parafilimonas sp.]